MKECGRCCCRRVFFFSFFFWSFSTECPALTRASLVGKHFTSNADEVFPMSKGEKPRVEKVKVQRQLHRKRACECMSCSDTGGTDPIAEVMRYAEALRFILLLEVVCCI